MIPGEIQHQLYEAINHLEPKQQERLLVLARELKGDQLPEGMSWEKMKHYAGSLPDEDAAEILAAIEEDCENIDIDEW